MRKYFGQVGKLKENKIESIPYLDKEKLVHELGDVLWYLSQIAEWADIPFDEVAQENIETLNKRYPNGFNPAN